MSSDLFSVQTALIGKISMTAIFRWRGTENEFLLKQDAFFIFYFFSPDLGVYSLAL